MNKVISKHVLLAITFIFMGMQSYAQFLKGKVVDESNGEPLIGATLQLEGTGVGTITALDGSFEFKGKIGQQNLIVSYVGYLKKEIKVSVKEGTNELEVIKLKTNAIGLETIKVVASYVKDRETPVSISTIKPQEIEEKLGTKEFPEILETTPSVYATKQGGGYGDSRINLRGFDSNNIGVLINGVPVNDMESGKVYWSNWAGLSDVTRTMQVQRGLGASKLALSSVGGTINIITKSTDAKKGGSVYFAAGNDNYNKKSFTVSTGLMDNNWAVTLSGARAAGDGFVRGTNFVGYSYFANISKKINDKHFISLTAFGAPQWHNQRSTRHLVSQFKTNAAGIKWNSDYGIREGKIYGSGHAYNRYHKPQISLNHNWQIDKTSSWATAAYASISNGGGRRISGKEKKWLGYDYRTGLPYDNTKLTEDGLLDFDAVIAENKASVNGSKAIVSMSVNRHDWYGLLSNYTKQFDNIKMTVGVDGRYYRGYHYTEIKDLLGGKYFLDKNNVNRDRNKGLQVGDKIGYYNLGDVLWSGIFAQGEYVRDAFSAFINLSGSSNWYRRVDFFKYKDDDPMQTSEWVNFINYSAKGGVNYNLNEKHNVFANAGYFTRAPYFRFAFNGYSNEINKDAIDEKIFSAEIGYGFKSANASIDITLYHTEWRDKGMTRSLGQNLIANIENIDAIHSGIEATAFITPIDKLKIKAMGSIGNWRWGDNVESKVYDENQQYIETIYVYAKDLKVGDAAQTTASLGFDYEVLDHLKIGATYKYFGNNYAKFSIDNRTNASEEGVDAWQIPNYQLLDANIRYNFKISKFNATLVGNVDNVLDNEYISDALDGIGHDEATSPVYYGYGRTWRISLKVKF